MNRYKEILLECQKLLDQGDFDNLVKKIEELAKTQPQGLTKEEAEEALRILDFLISQVEKKQQELFNKMVNYQKFKNYLR